MRNLSPEDIARLDERMKAEGMIPLSELLDGNSPLDRFQCHAAVSDMDSFEWWLKMRFTEMMSMRIKYELGDKSKDDDMFEWVFAHAAAFGECLLNFRQAKQQMAAKANPENEGALKP